MGIDPSLTGFAVAYWQPDRQYTSRYTSKHKGVDRLKDIAAWLYDETEVITGLDVGHVCLEGYANGAKYGREAMGELGAAVKMTLTTMFPDPVCYPTIVAPTRLKKFVTDSGSSKKERMLMEVLKKWRFEAPTNDEADAYALARMAACAMGIERTKYKYEAEVIAALDLHTERP